MKKYIIISLCLALLTLTCCGCTCDHQWQEANCGEPMTCLKCGETEGEPTGEHDWAAATTEAPMTCRVCGLMQGDLIDVDERFHTEDCMPYFGKWTTTYEMDDSETGIPGLSITMKLTMQFSINGVLTISRTFKSLEDVRADYANALAAYMYQQYATAGKNQTEADTACMAIHGQTVTEFAQAQADRASLSLESKTEKVYYVEDGILYTGEDWGSDMYNEACEMGNNGTFTLLVDGHDQPLEFRRTAN